MLYLKSSHTSINEKYCKRTNIILTIAKLYAASLVGNDAADRF